MDAVGEVQVIANGYTAENGRNNGGLINVVTKSGTNTFKGSAWYNGRRDDFNANDYFRKINNQAKPLYDVNISGYSFGGPLVIPKVYDSRKAEKRTYFFVSQEFTDDARPSVDGALQSPDRARARGRFLADPDHERHHPADHRSANRSAVPRQHHPAGSHQPARAGDAQPAADAERPTEPGGGSAMDVELGLRRRRPSTAARTTSCRIDQVFTDKTRASFKLLKDRDDVWSYNNFTPGTGHVANNAPGIVASSTITQVIRPTIVNEMNFGYTHNRWGFYAGPETAVGKDFDYTTLYASKLGINAPRLAPFGDILRSAAARRIRRPAGRRVAVRTPVLDLRRRPRQSRRVHDAPTATCRSRA